MRQTGFSLLETTIVLLIVSVLMMGVTKWVHFYQQQHPIQTNEQRLDYIKQQLMGYYRVNQRLPCSDTDQDGVENRNEHGICELRSGRLPYRDLKLRPAQGYDAFDVPLTYVHQVDESLSLCFDESCLSSIEVKVLVLAENGTDFASCQSSHLMRRNCDLDATFILLPMRLGSVAPFTHQIMSLSAYELRDYR